VSAPPVADPPPGLTRNPDFLKLWAAQSVSVIGSAITNLALPTAAILALHANPFEVGFLAALQRLPFLFFSLPAGAWLDRVNRRPVMIACDLGRGAVLAIVPVAGLLGLLALWQLFLAAFLVGTLTVFFDVAYLAYLPALVSRRDLLGGNQRMQMTSSVANLVGPGLGGILIQLIGAAFAIAANSASFVFSAVMLLLIRAEPRIPARTSPSRMRDEIAEGLRWVFHHPLLRSQLIGLTLAGFGFFFALPMVLVFAYDNLHLTPGLVGGVFVLEGVASLVGLSIAPRVVRALRLGPTMWVTQIGVGAGFMLIPLAAVTAPLLVLAVSQAIIGLFDSVQDVNQVTLRQTLTPPRLQGRMNATFRLFYWGSWPIASIAGGAFGALAGAGPTIIVGGAMGVLSAAIIAFSPLGRLRERATEELGLET
jgi:MFS family permease